MIEVSDGAVKKINNYDLNLRILGFWSSVVDSWFCWLPWIPKPVRVFNFWNSKLFGSLCTWRLAGVESENFSDWLFSDSFVDMEGNQKRVVDDAGCQPVKASILCVNNCGFFGTAATKNFCSKCYRDFFLKQSKGATVKVVAGKKAVELITETENQIREGQETNAIPCGEGTTSKDPETRPANRCSFCKKRVGLTGFKCRCEQTFCSIHRYSDKHNCLFDYKSAAQDEIAKANPVVKADKIEKI